MSGLSGKHALVTGGGSGIGAAIALDLANAGALVTITGRRKKPLENIASSHDNINLQLMDVANEKNVLEALTAIQKTFGPIDILVANAGIAETAPIQKTTLDMWRKVQQINVEGVFLCIRELVGHMVEQKWGRIITIASVAGQKGVAYGSAYSASKHAVVGLTRSVAIEVMTKGVTVNAVCPGFVNTAIVEKSAANITAKTGMGEKQAVDILAKLNPFGRLIEPEEVSSAVLWLCDDNAGAVTGQTIQIAGGDV
ncbi:MAG: SDR family NAD(P)-dependent oxidoreductase [Rhizobiaceae bacterium]